MKSFHQFLEDTQQLRQGLRSIDREDRLSTRSQELAQRQRDKATEFQQRSLANAAAQKKKQQALLDRENLKKEIKRELQTEQTPTMQPNLYNQLVARQQARRKAARETHAQTEMGHEAQAQQAAKQRRLRAIMSR